MADRGSGRVMSWIVILGYAVICGLILMTTMGG